MRVPQLRAYAGARVRMRVSRVPARSREGGVPPSPGTPATTPWKTNPSTDVIGYIWRSHVT